MVWSKTTDVGCPIAQCNSVQGFRNGLAGYLVFCNYGPGGNIVGEKAYDRGPASSKCKSAFNSQTDANGLCAW